MSLTDARSFSRGTLDPAALESVIAESVRGTFAESTIRRLARVRARAAAAGKSGGVLVHDGDLTIDGDLSTGLAPAIRLLIVRGDLVVRGLYEDSLDPESIVVVTGDLRAERLISEGFLEVHGSVIASGPALFLDNDGCAEIFGDLRARLVYSKYHAVQVHGEVVAPLICGDAQHVRSPRPYAFVDETDPQMRGRIVRDVLMIVGDEDDEDGSIDCLDSQRLAEHVRAGRPIEPDPATTPAKKPAKKPAAKKLAKKPAAKKLAKKPAKKR